eukprot:2488957-Prymnesium_polylepis.1
MPGDLLATCWRPAGDHWRPGDLATVLATWRPCWRPAGATFLRGDLATRGQGYGLPLTGTF